MVRYIPCTRGIVGLSDPAFSDTTRQKGVARQSGVPVGFGVLTVEREEQALARSAPGPENKGGEAARAAVATVHALRALGAKRKRKR